MNGPGYPYNQQQRPQQQHPYPQHPYPQQQHPYPQQQHPYPPPPAKRGMSPMVIALIIGGGVFVLGGGSCLVLGGLAMLGASADDDPAVAEGERLGAPAATGTTGATGTPTAPIATAAPTATALVESGDDDDNDGAAPAATDTAGGTERPPSTGARPPATSTGGGGTWQCTASGSVRVCGFANVCNNQMVFGNGFGKDRYIASTQAKNACEGMARAKGGSTVCVVQCSAR